MGPGEVSGGFFFQETGSYLDAYDPSTPVDGTFGTGNGAVNCIVRGPLPTGRMRAPGVPQLLVNVFAEFKTKNGWGVGLGPQIIGRQDANDNDTLHIPTEYELDGYILWVPSKKWDVRVNLTNITSARVLDPIDVSFAGDQHDLRAQADLGLDHLPAAPLRRPGGVSGRGPRGAPFLVVGPWSPGGPGHLCSRPL